jgi:hypothetical protein
MSNRAYLRVWTRGFSDQTMIAEFARFLATAPVSSGGNGFKELLVQAVDPTETPVAEWDLRDRGFGAPQVAALAAQHLNADTAYIVQASWDLWVMDAETMKWQRDPQPLVLTCHGLAYDEGIAATAGHLSADLGFEHLFTGHAGLLASKASATASSGPEHPFERTFLQWMATEANRQEYAAKTRENIQHLFEWTEAIERALPVERSELWSEGEENFEARLDALVGER